MNLVSRAKNMLLSPKTEWDVVAGEAATTGSLYSGYVIPFTLVATACSFIGSAFFASVVSGMFGVHYTMMYWIGSHVMSWVLGLVGIYVSALIIDALAPSFGSMKGQLNALKLVVFASTGSWAGQILTIIPVLGWIASLAGGIYSIYLFYLGLPKLMGTPKEKVVGYMVVAALVMIVMYVIIGAIVSSIAGALFVTSAVINHTVMP
ncbi:MAG TPA: Yip1 family protein [Candidatus Kapabacteria bacterium]|nr:Yip1 family protein [Candidatus Kapabacteria bacterium]